MHCIMRFGFQLREANARHIGPTQCPSESDCLLLVTLLLFQFRPNSVILKICFHFPLWVLANWMAVTKKHQLEGKIQQGV